MNARRTAGRVAALMLAAAAGATALSNAHAAAPGGTAKGQFSYRDPGALQTIDNPLLDHCYSTPDSDSPVNSTDHIATIYTVRGDTTCSGTSASLPRGQSGYGQAFASVIFR
jgi:hypothetical protein